MIMAHGARLGLCPHPMTGWAMGGRCNVHDRGAIPPSATQVNNHFPALVPRMKTPNPYLSYVINFRATGQVGVRFVNCAKEGTVARAMSALAMFQAPRLRGSGSCFAPHATWGSVEQALRSGDLVYLFPGEHEACTLKNVHALRDRPIVVMPVGYDPSVPLNKDGPLTTVRAEGGPAVKAVNCSEIRFCGMRLICESDSTGVVAENSEGLRFEGNLIMADVMCAYDGPNPMANTNVHMLAAAMASIRAAMNRTYPAPFLILSYVLVGGLYVMLAMMCLFVTSAMTEAEADEWIQRSGVSIALKILLVTPCTAVLKVYGEFLTAELPIGEMDLEFS